MIPIFPKFKKISRNDREEIIAHTKKYLPYSDFNFNSLWAWDTTGDMHFSDLNGNLVVRMPDYLTSEPIMSFIGIKKLPDTISSLLDYREKRGLLPELTLVPEVAINKLTKTKLTISEDRSHFDYVFSTRKLSELKGRSFKAKRQLSNKFIAEHQDAVFKTSPVSDPDSYKQILEVLKAWEGKKAKKDDLKLENKAIKRMLKLSKLDKNELILAGVYLHDELLAFSIDEILSNGYALSHFYKIKSEFRGVSEYLNQKTAEFLHENGVELWSWEQDLGLEGLRRSKSSYRPVQFLKKYKISKK